MEIVSLLHPPRLPESFTQGGSADLLLAFGLGLLLAGVIVMLAAPLLVTRPRARPLRARLADLDRLPAADRLHGLAMLAHDRGIALTDAERAALYGGGAMVDDAVASLGARIPGRGSAS